MQKEISLIFKELTSPDKNKEIDKYTQSKGNFKYLSWAYAVRELLRVDPGATWEIHEWGLDGSTQPYQQTQAGCFVKVTVWSGGIARHQVHPVLDHRNQPIMEPNAYQIKTSIQRCLAKAIALHGLGLYIYAGEDIPADPLTEQQTTILLEAAIAADKEVAVLDSVKSGKIHSDNYKGALAKLQREASK